MTAASHAEIELSTIITERAGTLALARRHCAQVDVLIGQRRLSADEGGHVKQAIRAFADQVAQGLHRDGADPAGVRAAMRAVVMGEGGQ